MYSDERLLITHCHSGAVKLSVPINTLFISLEASFRLVLRRLKADGNPEPTAADAAIFLHDTFNDVHRLEKYFEEDYERRIISFHPESRFGTYSTPPFFVDDFYFLFNDLLEVYRFLLIGYVHPMHQEKIGSLPQNTDH